MFYLPLKTVDQLKKIAAINDQIISVIIFFTRIKSNFRKMLGKFRKLLYSFKKVVPPI